MRIFSPLGIAQTSLALLSLIEKIGDFYKFLCRDFWILG